MKVLDEHTKFAHLGKPGSVFSLGFRRRLVMVTNLVDFKNKTILDMGCGEGVWLAQFCTFTPPGSVFGSEYDGEQVEALKDSQFLSSIGIPSSNIKHCPGEALAFADDFFDIVFQNEVLEHVKDDVQTLTECLRVLKPGGKLIIFTPNRGWPFETHGMFLYGKYYWGNIPLLPWLPQQLYQKLAPHVRNYSNNELRCRIYEACISLTEKNPHTECSVVYHQHVFPGFDGAVRRFGFLGKLMQRFFFLLEKTPLHHFGISHLIIIEKRRV